VRARVGVSFLVRGSPSYRFVSIRLFFRCNKFDLLLLFYCGAAAAAAAKAAAEAAAAKAERQQKKQQRMPPPLIFKNRFSYDVCFSMKLVLG